MGCYQFTGTFECLLLVAYMMDWLLTFSCGVEERRVDLKKEFDGET